MTNGNSLFVAAAFASLLLSGCATSPSGPAPATQAQAPLREVPGLKVVNDCGACKVRASVPTLIVDGYRSAASKAGARLATSQEATLAIKVYSARDDGARFFGVLAGKDEIKATVSFKGTQFMVEDYYYTAWLGIEDLAKNIGEMVFEQMNRQAR